MTEIRPYPLLFAPVYKEYIWGGDRIRRLYGRSDAPARCAESWEIADRPEGESVVVNGSLAGRTLGQLCESDPAGLIGRPHSGRFPILCKIIDAAQRLSVQVHPAVGRSDVPGVEPKTEVWCVLAAQAGARVWAGLRSGTTRLDLENAVRAGSVEELLREVPVSVGDVVFVPAGLVHAIGEGCLIYEVQQNSNTTYRLFDWNRVDSSGAVRPLHVEQALDAIAWDIPVGPHWPSRGCLRSADSIRGNAITLLVESPFFVVERVTIAGVIERPEDAEPAMWILFVEHGRIAVAAGGAESEVGSGTTILVPASAGECAVGALGGRADVLRIRMPSGRDVAGHVRRGGQGG